jgi:probable rRNA maturation factor
MTPQRHPAAASPIVIDILIESRAWRAVPAVDALVRRACSSAAEAVELHPGHVEVAILLCDDGAIAKLNSHWRGIARATNVLSFPAASPGDTGFLGDIAIAYETVAREAHEQGIAVGDHVAHLVIHGFLHLLGYDHESEGEAERMEGLERDILARIGIADPYASCDA